MCDAAGTDIVSVARIAALVRQRGDAFLGRWFTAGEIEYCTAKAEPSRHFAARLAAKEAVLKALPTEWDGPPPWRSIEISHDARGAPVVRLHGALEVAARQAGVRNVHVSMSHCDEFATAIALMTLGREETVAGHPLRGDEGPGTADYSP